MSVTAYPVANKRKSFEICLAFVRGCGGQIGTKHRPEGAAVFYGVDHSNVDVWNAVRASGQEFYYLDNSVFDSARQTQFRVCKNRLQHTGVGQSDGKRFRALGIDIMPWRTAGEHILVCPQSAPFMRTVVDYQNGDWTANMLARLRAETTREIRLRSWARDKGQQASTLEKDLVSAHALVTWSSAAAVTAVLAGVPVLVESPDCAARPMSGQDIGALPTPDRESWAGCLADNEWTLDEMRKGMTWHHLQN